jgi:hypothetical protein
MGGKVPSEEAQAVLRRLYDVLVREDPKYKSRSEFYPVQVERIPAILNWSVDELSQAGVPRDNTSDLHGVTDYFRRTITLSTRTLRDEVIQKPQVRFTLAHELGHVCLHGPLDIHDPNRPQRVLPQRTLLPRPLQPLPRAELDANAFAAELLMPERIYRSEFQRRFRVAALWHDSEVGQPIWTTLPSPKKTLWNFALAVAGICRDDTKPLSDFFGVSISAAAFRLTALELVKCPK